MTVHGDRQTERSLIDYDTSPSSVSDLDEGPGLDGPAPGRSIDPARADDVIRRCDDTHPWVLIDDQVVVHRLWDVSSFVLNPVASLLWQCLDGESRLEEILADLADVYQVETEQILTDFLPVVGQWLADDIAVVLNREVQRGTNEPEVVTPHPHWWRLPMPPNDCGSAAKRDWDHHLVLGVNGAVVTVASDDAHEIEALRPWAIDPSTGIDSDVVDYVLQVEPPRSEERGMPRYLPTIRHGSCPRYRLRDTTMLRGVFRQLLTSFGRPESPSQIRLALMPVLRDGRALLVPPSQGAAISHRWYVTRGLEPIYTEGCLIDVEDLTVRVEPPLGAEPGVASTDQWYPVVGWWLPSAKPWEGISPGHAVAHTMRLALGVMPDNVHLVLEAARHLVAAHHPGLAPMAPDSALERVDLPVVTEMRQELLDAMSAALGAA